MADKIRLLDSVKNKTTNKLDLKEFKEAVMDLFTDVLKGGYIEDREIQGRIARLRARVEIELRDL